MKSGQGFFFSKLIFFKLSILDVLTISPLYRPRRISQNVSGLYYVRRGSSYKIYMFVKLYYLGRAKVFSSVATDFGFWTSLLLTKTSSFSVRKTMLSAIIPTYYSQRSFQAIDRLRWRLVVISTSLSSANSCYI